MDKNKSKINIETDINKEWLITNGIGGYASSTILGCNTRKYHGLLVASLNPPARRYVILSKLDESIEFNNKKYDLYTNMCKNNISKGYQYIENFENEYVPIITFKIEDVVVKKVICMQYGKNITCIMYKIKNGNHKTKITLAPVISYRNAHTVNKSSEYNAIQKYKDNTIKIFMDNKNKNPICIKISEGKYIEHRNDIFRGMYYIEEEKRGLEAEDNLLVPGRFEIEINANEEKEISCICSYNEDITKIEAREVVRNEIVRLRKLLTKSRLYKKEDGEEERNYLQQYINSTDNFITYRNSLKLHTVLAGYHWFLDWGRDTLIAFEGIVLIPKRFDIAKEVLLTFINNMKDGLIPNGFSD